MATTTKLGRPAIGVVLTPNGTEHFISQPTAEALLAANNDDMVELDDGTQLKVSMATEIMPLDEYYKQHPDKQPSGAQQPAPRQFSHDRQAAVHELIQDWTPLCTKLNFHQTEQLVLNTWESLEKWQGSFEDYCIKHQALTPDGKVTTTKLIEDGVERRVPFAYPFFCAVRDAIEAVTTKEKWEEEHTVDFNDPTSFEKIIDKAPPSGLAAMIRGLDKYLAGHPNNHAAQKLRAKMAAKLGQSTP